MNCGCTALMKVNLYFSWKCLLTHYTIYLFALWENVFCQEVIQFNDFNFHQYLYLFCQYNLNSVSLSTVGNKWFTIKDSKNCCNSWTGITLLKRLGFFYVKFWCLFVAVTSWWSYFFLYCMQGIAFLCHLLMVSVEACGVYKCTSIQWYCIHFSRRTPGITMTQVVRL